MQSSAVPRRACTHTVPDIGDNTTTTNNNNVQPNDNNRDPDRQDRTRTLPKTRKHIATAVIRTTCGTAEGQPIKSRGLEWRGNVHRTTKGEDDRRATKGAACRPSIHRSRGESGGRYGAHSSGRWLGPSRGFPRPSSSLIMVVGSFGLHHTDLTPSLSAIFTCFNFMHFFVRARVVR